MSDNSLSNSSTQLFLTNCLESRMAIFIFTSMLVTDFLLLIPLFLFIFYLSLRRWWKHRSSSAASVMSHSDLFTYNVAVLELIRMLAAFLYCFGAYKGDQSLQWVGNSMFYLTHPGLTLFHLLTCVERYMAVVHPITYLGLKQGGGVKIRNISTGCVWLLCFGLMCLIKLVIVLAITCFCIMVFSLIAVSFCSFSVLYVLNHPGPGEVSGDRERVDQSKQRAFHAIVAITVALLLRFVGILVCAVMFSSPLLTHTICAVGATAMWLAMPCSLVLPLMFLQRAGKLPGCKHKTDSG